MTKFDGALVDKLRQDLMGLQQVNDDKILMHDLQEKGDEGLLYRLKWLSCRVYVTSKQ